MMSSENKNGAQKTTGDIVVGDGSEPEFAVRINGENVEGQRQAEANAGQEGDVYDNIQNMIDGTPAE